MCVCEIMLHLKIFCWVLLFSGVKSNIKAGNTTCLSLLVIRVVWWVQMRKGKCCVKKCCCTVLSQWNNFKSCGCLNFEFWFWNDSLIYTILLWSPSFLICLQMNDMLYVYLANSVYNINYFFQSRKLWFASDC